MAVPLAGVVVGSLGAVVAKLFEFFYQFLAFKLATRLAVGTAFLVVSASITVTMAMAIKAALLLARVALPPHLAVATYFLPANLNQFLAVYITIASIRFIWAWSYKNLAGYTQTVY